MLFGAFFVRFNDKYVSKKLTKFYIDALPHCPELTVEEKNRKEKVKYGALADKALKNPELLKQIDDDLREAENIIRNTPKKGGQISHEDHMLLQKMGAGVKGIQITDTGLIVKSDWSYCVQKDLFRD